MEGDVGAARAPELRGWDDAHRALTRAPRRQQTHPAHYCGRGLEAGGGDGTRNSQLATRNSQLATRNSQLATRAESSAPGFLCLALIVACGVPLSGCGGGKAAPSDGPTASAGQNIWRGVDDADDAYSDAVVFVSINNGNSWCTGTLITSELVLTANHCFAGDTITPDRSWPVAGSYVHVGADRFSPKDIRPIYSVISMLGGAPTTEDTRDRDIALLVVAPPRTPTHEDDAYPSALSTASFAEGTYMLHVAYAGWGATETGSYPAHRQLALYGAPTALPLFVAGGSAGGQTWNADWSGLYYGPAGGDSGGPLYQLVTNPSGQVGREQIGVTEGGTARDNDDGNTIWVDVTTSAVKDWIEHAGADLARRNGKLIGQTDYTGPCQTDVDQDCDRFYDSDDNCPTIFNPLQAIGPDSDGDGLPDYCDNCIDRANKDQKDSDGDKFGDACDVCPAQTPDPFCTTNADCGPPPNRCVRYLDYARQDPACYDSIGAATCYTSRCAGDKDADGDGIGDVCDNCPGTVSTDVNDCNLNAEEELGVKKKPGDACDPVPCPQATVNSVGFVNKFNATCSDPNTAATDCDDIANTEIDWHGVQKKDVTPETATAATGVTEFAHCNCAGPSDVGGRITQCEFAPDGSRLCSIARASDYPPVNARSMTSAWDAMTTQSTGLDCVTPGSCPPTSHEQVTSAYELSNNLWDNRTVVWRPDFDLSFIFPFGATVGNEQQLVAVAPDFDGLTWAHTPHFNGNDLSMIPLPSATTRPATYSDDASHYFVQDLDAQHSFNIPFVECPPGAGCGGFSAYTDQICPTCPVQSLSSWLHLGNVVVELNPRLSQDVTNRVDTTLLNMLSDSGLTVVPVSESTSFQSATGTSLRAIAVDNTTLTSPGFVADTPSGVEGFGNLRPPPNPVDPPPPVFAASATRELGFAVAASGGAEELTLIPVGGGPNTTVPLTGIDADATADSLAYRFEDRNLYLVDEVHHHWLSWLRIVRIQPDSGAATAVAWRPIPDDLGSVYLSVDDAGQLVIATTEHDGDVSFFTTFAVKRHHLRVTGWLEEDGTLVAPPDTRGDSGYSVVMRKPESDKVEALEIPASALVHEGPNQQHPGHGPPEPHGHQGHGAHNPGPPPWH
jgi:Trypsin/Thrombospondin type 3 repeat